MGIRVRPLRCAQRQIPEFSEHYRRKGRRASGRLFWCLPYRPAHLLGLDCPQIWVQMDIHHWSLHLRGWCFDVLALGCQPIICRFLRFPLHRRLRPLHSRDFCKPLHCHLWTAKTGRVPSRALSILSSRRLGHGSTASLTGLLQEQ